MGCVVVFACFCLSFFFEILNNESLAVVRLGWVCMRACGGGHRRKQFLSWDTFLIIELYDVSL